MVGGRGTHLLCVQRRKDKQWASECRLGWSLTCSKLSLGRPCRSSALDTAATDRGWCVTAEPAPPPNREKAHMCAKMKPLPKCFDFVECLERRRLALPGPGSQDRPQPPCPAVPLSPANPTWGQAGGVAWLPLEGSTGMGGRMPCIGHPRTGVQAGPAWRGLGIWDSWGRSRQARDNWHGVWVGDR